MMLRWLWCHLLPGQSEHLSFTDCEWCMLDYATKQSNRAALRWWYANCEREGELSDYK